MTTEIKWDTFRAFVPKDHVCILPTNQSVRASGAGVGSAIVCGACKRRLGILSFHDDDNPKWTYIEWCDDKGAQAFVTDDGSITTLAPWYSDEQWLREHSLTFDGKAKATK